MKHNKWVELRHLKKNDIAFFTLCILICLNLI